MKLRSLMGNPFGCSASGERLVSAARDGDLQEAKALLECNPRLIRYSTFGVRNSPLHYSAARGHHEIVSLLLESGMEINLRNYRGQTALMQACHYGHWEVVLTLILFKADIHKADYLNGGTALHFAAINGHSLCSRLLLADYIPSLAGIFNITRSKATKKASSLGFDQHELSRVINKPADGGITALHMAALNGHVECVQLLLDLGASVTAVTVEDGTTVDLIGSGSTALHYAACGGNAQCCQMLICGGADLTTENANGWNPLLVARLWHRHWLEEVLSKKPEHRPCSNPSPYLSLPLMSVIRIARECRRGNPGHLSTSVDPCSVCLERKCLVAAEGCRHELCTQCALYLCCTSNTATSSGAPGSIPCPFCRHAIVSFMKLPDMNPIKDSGKPSLSLAFYTTSTGEPVEPGSIVSKSYRVDLNGCCRITPSASSSFRSLSEQRFGSMKLSTSFCMGGSETSPSLLPCSDRRAQNQMHSRTVLRRSTSHIENRTAESI